MSDFFHSEELRIEFSTDQERKEFAEAYRAICEDPDASCEEKESAVRALFEETLEHIPPFPVDKRRRK